MAETLDFFVKMPSWLLRRRELGAVAKLVWCYFTYRQGGNVDCYPSIRTIADDCGDISQGAVLRGIDELEEAGLVKVSRPEGNSGGKFNRYRVVDPKSGGGPQRTRGNSAPETEALSKKKSKRSRNGSRSAPETGAESDPRKRSKEKNSDVETGAHPKLKRSAKLRVVAVKTSRKPPRSAPSNRDLLHDAMNEKAVKGEGFVPSLLAALKGDR